MLTSKFSHPHKDWGLQHTPAYTHKASRTTTVIDIRIVSSHHRAPTQPEETTRKLRPHARPLSPTSCRVGFGHGVAWGERKLRLSGAAFTSSVLPFSFPLGWCGSLPSLWAVPLAFLLLRFLGDAAVLLFFWVVLFCCSPSFGWCCLFLSVSGWCCFLPFLRGAVFPPLPLGWCCFLLFLEGCAAFQPPFLEWWCFSLLLLLVGGIFCPASSFWCGGTPRREAESSTTQKEEKPAPLEEEKAAPL